MDGLGDGGTRAQSWTMPRVGDDFQKEEELGAALVGRVLARSYFNKPPEPPNRNELGAAGPTTLADETRWTPQPGSASVCIIRSRKPHDALPRSQLRNKERPHSCGAVGASHGQIYWTRASAYEVQPTWTPTRSEFRRKSRSRGASAVLLRRLAVFSSAFGPLS